VYSVKQKNPVTYHLCTGGGFKSTSDGHKTVSVSRLFQQCTATAGLLDSFKMVTRSIQCAQVSSYTKLRNVDSDSTNQPSKHKAQSTKHQEASSTKAKKTVNVSYVSVPVGRAKFVTILGTALTKVPFKFTI
jgi:hypothetical protein